LRGAGEWKGEERRGQQNHPPATAVVFRKIREEKFLAQAASFLFSFCKRSILVVARYGRATSGHVRN